MSPDKRQISKKIYALRLVKTWQLLVLFVLLAFVAATFLRLNNVGMLQRLDAVISADKEGADQTDIRARLFDLQRYVNSHMNTDTGVFYLAGQYERDTQKVLDEINQTTGGASVNAKAEAICKPQFTHYTYAYTECMLNEILKQKVADPTATPKKPNPDLYRHSYVSPLFTWDFAGLSVLLSLAILVIILARGVSLALLKMLLKRHYRGI
jgi:hypothetical protein